MGLTAVERLPENRNELLLPPRNDSFLFYPAPGFIPGMRTRRCEERYLKR